MDFFITPIYQQNFKRDFSKEKRFWNKYKPIIDKKNSSVINCISTSDNTLIYTHGYTINIVNLNSVHKPQKISRPGPNLASSCIRRDGILAGIGDTKGEIKIRDIVRKVNIKIYKRHLDPVYALDFNQHSSVLVSGGDDRTINFYDYVSGRVTNSITEAHTGFIRALRTFKTNENLIVTGGYDSLVKIFDIRENNSIDGSEQEARAQSTFKHKNEIQGITLFQDDTKMAVVEGKNTNLWDLRKPDEPLQSLSFNNKTVNTVRSFESQNRLITSSIDCHLKIFELDTLKLIHQIKFKNPITTFALSSDFSHLAVGMSDGSLTLRVNKSIPRGVDSTLKFDYDNFYKLDIQTEKESLSYKYFNRGIYNKEVESRAHFVEFLKAKKLRRYDKFLRKFKYGLALKHALTSKDTQVITGVIEELVYRNGLDIALKNLDETDLLVLLSFIYKKLDSANHQQVVFFVMERCFELGVFVTADDSQNASVDRLLTKIREKIQLEARVGNECSEIEGILDVIEALS